MNHEKIPIEISKSLEFFNKEVNEKKPVSCDSEEIIALKNGTEIIHDFIIQNQTLQKKEEIILNNIELLGLAKNSLRLNENISLIDLIKQNLPNIDNNIDKLENKLNLFENGNQESIKIEQNQENFSNIYKFIGMVNTYQKHDNLSYPHQLKITDNEKEVNLKNNHFYF